MKNILLALTVASATATGIFAQTNKPATLKENDNKTALEVYNILKDQPRSRENRDSRSTPRVNISGYAVKVGPDVYGLPSVEVSETKGGKARTLCVLPFKDYLKLRHVSKGDKVVLNGEVRGYSDEYDIIVVKQSRIVSVNGKNP